MSVSLSPSGQLGFPRPLTQLVKRTLSVANHNSQPVAFKVKTTAPKQYCVRPNSGRIEPGETVEVQVLLQPMKEDPAPGAKCRDKFLVQSVVITPDREQLALPDLWSEVERADKAAGKDSGSIQEQKIRCAYLPSAEEPPVPAVPGNAAASNGHSLAASSTTASTFTQAHSEDDDSRFATVRPTAANGAQHARADAAFAPAPQSPAGHAADLAQRPETPPPSFEQHLASVKESVVGKSTSVSNSGLGAAVAGAAAAVGLSGSSPQSSSTRSPPASSTTSGSRPLKEALESSAGTSKDDDAISSVRQELTAAQAEIARLKTQLAQAETTTATLRSRGQGAGSASGELQPGSAQALAQPKGQDGVPLQIVAGIAFGVFVFTWLFF